MDREQVPEHVPEKSTGFPRASSEPVRPTVQVLEHVPATGGTRTRECPRAEIQARALLHWLQVRHAGQKLRADYVKGRAYPAMIEERGWYAQPWDGRHGVGKHLTTLLGGKATGYVIEPDGSRRRARGYRIPLRRA
jgi:hypothetical protein